MRLDENEATRQMQRRPAPNATKMSRELHVPFVLTALAFAILGGFSLAIVLPVEAALGIGTASRVSHAQIHGHMQVVGFVGVMVVGIAYHLIPAFKGRSLAAARLTPHRWCCWRVVCCCA
ncbi:MAG: hypothetical protein DWI59_05725 [Chloroflexi bacterium]|nr:MAG: hypothetical protein DWI59_05725 [Chloroflexota bacterium]